MFKGSRSRLEASSTAWASRTVRWGGVHGLLSRGAEETRHIAERIRQDILDLNIVHERYEPLCRVSVSLGLTSLVPEQRRRKKR